MALSYNVVKSALDAAKAATGGKFVAFDASFYVANYSVVRDATGAVIDNSLSSYSGDPLQHYVAQGAAAGYTPNAWFDPTFYRAQYNDVTALSAADLIVHYALYGVNEGRAPSAALVNFNGTRYLADNPDVLPYVQANLASFGGSLSNGALAHYLKFGALEQRKAFDLSGGEIPFTLIPDHSTIAGTKVGDVTTVSLNTNDGDTLLVGSAAVIDGGASGTSVLRLVGDADVRIDLTNPNNQVRGIDLNGDGVIASNGVENNVSAAGVATFKNFEIVDAYARNPLNIFDHARNFSGDIAFDGTSFAGREGDGTKTDGNIFLGGLGADTALTGVGNDFLAGGGVIGSGQDSLSGGRNADFFFTELSLLDNTDGDSLFIDGGNTADNTSAGVGSSSQDNDWLLVEASDDDEPVHIILEDQNVVDADRDGDLIVGNGLVVTRSGVSVENLIDIENVDASGNMYGFLDDVNVAIGGGGKFVGVENVGQGSSAQLRIEGSNAANILIGGFDNDYIEGNGGADLLMGGNLNYLNNANLTSIVNNGRDELYGGAGDDGIVFEVDGGIIDGGPGSDTLWVTREALGTQNAATLTNDGVLRFELQNGDTGGDGNDTFAGYGGADVDGTADQTNYKSSSLRVNTDNMESVIATGLGAIDYLAAGTNAPELGFNNQQNHRGYEGDLDLRGTSGANTLYAFTGDDVLEGREGADKLSGGNGSDDFYFELTGEDGGDGVDVIHRQADANNDNIWDGTFARDFDIGGVQTLFDSTFTLGLPDTLAPYVDGVRFQLGGTVYQLSGLAAPTVGEWTTKLQAKLDATAGLESVEVDTVSANVITLTDPAGRAFVELTSSGWLLTGGGLPSDGLDAWFQDVGAPQSDESLDRLIYKAYEDRSDNEGVDDDGITGSQITLGRDSYAEDLVVDFAADGTRIAEDQSYTITFKNLTTEDTVTITVNGVTYQLQVGVSVDGTQVDAEDGVFDTQTSIQSAFLGRLAGFINSFMDDDTAAGSVSASNTGTTLTLRQNAYSDGEETVFMKAPTVVLTNQSGGEKATATVANGSQHEVHLLNYVASSLTGQLDRSERDDGSEAALNADNVLFVGQEFVNRSTLQTALDDGQVINGHDALVINGGVDDLIDVAHNLATDDELNTDHDDDGFGDETNGNFAVHGDDYLIGGAGDDVINGGTGDDRIRGSLGDGVLVDDVVDGGKDLYAVRLVGDTKYQVEVLNAYEAEQRDADSDVLDIYLIEQTESADQMIAGDNFVPYFQDTLIFHQADFSPGNTEFTIDLNNYLIDGVTGEVILDQGGAGDVSIDVEGDGIFDSLTVFTNFEHIRTVSGVSRAVAGDGQGNDTLIVTDLSDDTDGVYYNLTNDGDVGVVSADIEADDDDPEVRVWQDIIHVDGVENVIAGLGDDALDIDETEAAKNNLFSADLGNDTITYLNDFGDADVEPTVTIKVESSTNTDLVEMTHGRVGTTVATDTLVSVETIILAGDTAEGIREDDVLDATHIVRDVLVDFTEEEVRVDNNNDGDWTDAGELLVTIQGMYELENVLTDANDLVIVGDADYMSQNSRSDTDSTELIIDTYLNYDALDGDLNRESIADMRANNEANNDIPEARNFEQFTFNLGQATDRVDYSQTNDEIAALVAIDADTNYVLVGEDTDGSYANDIGDRVDALIGVEEIVASTAESILDFTALGQDVQVSFQFDETAVTPSRDRLESLIRIGDGEGNTIDGIPNFVEYYDLDDNDNVDPFATAAWTRIEGSDFSEAVFYDGSEDLVNLAGVDHRYTDDVLNLRGGANNVSYFALETSISAVVSVTEFDEAAPTTTGLIDVSVSFQDGSGGVLAGSGEHTITSYTGDNAIAAGSLKLEASQDAEDTVAFASLSDKVFLLGLSAGVLDVQIGDLDAMRLTGFELLQDAASDDVYDMADLTTVLGGLTLLDNLTDDEDTIVVRDDAVGFQAAPANTIDLGVLNDAFGFDFDILDVTNVTEDTLTLIGGSGGLPLGYDSVDALEPAAAITTTAVLGDQALTVTINPGTDDDWYQVFLEAGHTYTFTLAEGQATGVADSSLNPGWTEDDVFLALMNSAGTQITFDSSDVDDPDNGLLAAVITYTATVTGTFFVDAEDRFSNNVNTMILSVVETTDNADDGGDPESVVVGSLDLIDEVQLFDAIVFTNASIASAGDTFTVDLDAGEFKDAGNTVLFTIDGSLDTLDFSGVAATTDLDITVVDTAGVGLTIIGAGGDDTFLGAAGNDTFTGGAGADALDGGVVPEVAEVHTYTLSAPTGAAGETVIINGFTVTEGATIQGIVVAENDADAIGAAFVREWNANPTSFTDNALIDSITYDALTNALTFTFLKGGADVLDTELGAAGGTAAASVSAETPTTQWASETNSADTFVYLAAGDSKSSAIDAISNFNIDAPVGTIDDIIDLSAIDANSALAGDQAFTGLLANNAAQANFAAVSALADAWLGGANDLFVGRTGTDAYVFVDVDNSGLVSSGDLVIKLVGVTDVSGITTGENFVL